MESFKNAVIGVAFGTWDSIRGMLLVLLIDEEIHKLNAEKETERQKRLLNRQRRQRSPSPTPSSASAMERQTKEISSPPATLENPDERHIKSIRRKPETVPEKKKPQFEMKIAKQVLKCCFLNGGFTWLSIILFEQLLLPSIRFILTLCYGDDLHMFWGWLQSILSIIFGMMWVLPIFLLSKIVSSLWFADIANAAYRVRKGNPQMMSSLSKIIADFLFSLVVQALFLVQSMLVSLIPIPYVGEILYFVHLCMLYSLYCFEYKWFNMGWELHRRLNYIESNWPYFLGFGVPLTILTGMSNSIIVSSCIFSIFFPLFILSGNEARPLMGAARMPLRLFSPVIFVSNLFFNRSERQIQKSVVSESVIEKYGEHQPQHRVKVPTNERLMVQREQMEHKAQSKHRYQQPPAQARIPSMYYSHNPNNPSKTLRTTPERGPYMRPLVPTLVPGAPKAPPT